MTKVCGIRFKTAGKVYYFDPAEIEVKLGDMVIVETSRGIEMGECVLESKDVENEEIVKPLKPIIRKADDVDIDIEKSNRKKAMVAKEICLKKIEAHNLQMKLVDVEYTFDSSRIIFYFTADGRVDFRELVKDLASEFRTRIELRQIGVRDESKMVKGLGPCGREVCCGKWLTEFLPVSIKMAKDQNLSLNPIKISGLCNRLMCCLNYEHECYIQINANMPNIEDRVKTPQGEGIVIAVSILKEIVTVRLYNDKNELSEDLTRFHNSEVKVIEKSKQKKYNHQDPDEYSKEDLSDLED